MANNFKLIGGTPSRSELLGQIAEIGKTDEKRARKLYSMYENATQDASSPLYNAYSKPTNQAVGNLQNLGFDTRVLSDEWFTANDGWIRNNLEYRSGSTNTPSAPTKKSSRNSFSKTILGGVTSTLMLILFYTL